MKKLIFYLLYFVVLGYMPLLYADSLTPKQIQVFDKIITINDNCTVEVVSKNATNTKQTLKLNLPHTENCHFVTYSKTSVIHMEIIKQHYVVLIESSKIIDPKDEKLGCETRYQALAVGLDGSIKLSKKINGGSACHMDRERSEFVYLMHGIIK